MKQYKHQWHLIDAIAPLIQQGYSLELNLIGVVDTPALSRMKMAIARTSHFGSYIHFHGHLSHTETLDCFKNADIFIFPSTCETFGISLLEAMAPGKPIVCSDRGPMVEILPDTGIYFNPESFGSIVYGLKKLLNDCALRIRASNLARSYATNYSCGKCAHKTFSFLQEIAHHHFK